MRSKIDLIGKQFQDNVVLKQTGNHPSGDPIYLVECVKCKRTKESRGSVIRAGRGMGHRACGKGLKLIDKRFYGIWCNIRTRTNNPKFHAYAAYGGRGINSDGFEYFIDFYDVMYESYKEHVDTHGESQTTIERISVHQHYCKRNCRWATWKEQHSNLRSQRDIQGILGKKVYIFKNVNAFAREMDISASTIKDYLTGRLKSAKGWHFEFI